MKINVNSSFYKQAKKLLDDYVAKGSNVSDLKSNDPIYRYIKNSRAYDADGNIIGLEDKFLDLGYPRKAKMTKDVRADLIHAIEEYLNSGGSLHVRRKSLPFYDKLLTYSRVLKRNGKELSHEQIMREDLGYRQYSDMYFRCLGLSGLNKYEDGDGFVDEYRRNESLSNYITELALTIQVPYYIIITLLADKKLKFYDVSLDKVAYTKTLLKNYAERTGSLIGIKRNDPVAYNAFDHLINYFSDGNGERYSKEQWLSILGLEDYVHDFRSLKTTNTDISDIMIKLKNEYGDKIIYSKDIDSNDYRKIIKKAVELGVPVSEVFGIYGLKVRHLKVARLSRTRIKELPFLEEMITRRDELIKEFNISLQNGYSVEEAFEVKVKAVKVVYDEYKDKLVHYLLEFNSFKKREEGITV